MDRDRHPKLNRVLAYKSLHDCTLDSSQLEDTSLSDLHDYEPCLEFDDTELQTPGPGLAPLPPELLDFQDDVVLKGSSDGTIEENFEEELGKSLSYPQFLGQIADGEAVIDEDCFDDYPVKGLVEVVGDDKLGRRVVTITASRLPPTSVLHSDKLLRYLIFALDKYVEQDYIVVYYHCGLTSANRPPMFWIWKAYKELDRKFKKNLKALYVVHPTNLIRVALRMLRPVISGKFFTSHKMNYINYIHELREHIDLDTLAIPEDVLEHDNELLARDPAAAREAELSWRAAGGRPGGVRPRCPAPCGSSTARGAVTPAHQFGVSIEFIRDHNPCMIDSIPPIVRYCVDFLSKPDALEMEGIFRRSTTVTKLRRMIEQCNSGNEVDFDSDPHQAAALLKSFFRELEDPVLTHVLYEEIMQFPSWTNKTEQVKALLLEQLPVENYRLLKYMAKFLAKVADRSCMNKMTMSNLAVVFGPNFLWPPVGRLSLQCIEPINLFTEFILTHQDEFFLM